MNAMECVAVGATPDESSPGSTPAASVEVGIQEFARVHEPLSGGLAREFDRRQRLSVIDLLAEPHEPI